MAIHSVQFQDLMVLFGNNFYRKPTGSDSDDVLIRLYREFRIKSFNYTSLHSVGLLFQLVRGLLKYVITDFFVFGFVI